MGITFEAIQEANKIIKTMPIERKDKKTGAITSKEYAVVNERIKAFRMLYPAGAIITEVLQDDGDRCVFKATILNEEGKIIGTGTAFELKSSSFINASSYIENCETSAVGRALAMCGIGIDVSIASYEEVANAMKNQNKEENMQPLPVDKETKPKGKTKAAEPKEDPMPKKPEECGYPTREEMLADAKSFYEAEDKKKDLAELYKHWNIESLDKLTDAQLMTLYRMHHR